MGLWIRCLRAADTCLCAGGTCFRRPASRSKLFLDHKTLYYDVDPFLFYVLCERDEARESTRERTPPHVLDASCQMQLASASRYH